MRAPRLVPAVAAAVLLAALTAWSGVAQATTAHPAATGSVRLTADTVGLSFTGETVAADGTVTDTWTNASGWQFQYTGPPGGTMQESLSGTTLDMAAAAPAAGPIQSWCVKAIQGSGRRITGCNERTALFSAPNNHFIADDMTSQAHAPSGLRYDSIYMTYNWNGNQIISEDPLGDVGTHCNPVAFGVTWYGLSFTANELTCDGTLRPWGQSSNQGGGNWTANLVNPTGTISIEEILKTHAPARTTPDSVLHLRAVWS